MLQLFGFKYLYLCIIRIGNSMWEYEQHQLVLARPNGQTDATKHFTETSLNVWSRIQENDQAEAA